MQSPDDLPEPALTHDRHGSMLLIGPCYTAEQMRAYRAEGVAQERERCAAERDNLNSERLDLAMLIQRLLVRMRAARNGQGIVDGDESLRQAAIGYLVRKGLYGTALRDDQDAIRAGHTTS
jgi:hypothetical protein